jgi:putative toxin-antitoxin system antitoxin component (TIGR02293 family)
MNTVAELIQFDKPRSKKRVTAKKSQPGKPTAETRVAAPAANKSGWRFFREEAMSMSGVERHALVIKGLSTRTLKETLGNFHRVSESTLLGAIGLSLKTLSRRNEALLGTRHSDAALALIEISAMAEHVLGTADLAERWLGESAVALDGKRPLDLLTSTPGIEAVKDLLTRMEYGVYA